VRLGQRVSVAGPRLRQREGTLVDVGASPVPWPPRQADPLDEGGRGLVLAGAVVDRLDYQRVGDQNRWLLERFRH